VDTFTLNKKSTKNVSRPLASSFMRVVAKIFLVTLTDTKAPASINRRVQGLIGPNRSKSVRHFQNCFVPSLFLDPSNLFWSRIDYFWSVDPCKGLQLSSPRDEKFTEVTISRFILNSDFSLPIF